MTMTTTYMPLGSFNGFDPVTTLPPGVNAEGILSDYPAVTDNQAHTYAERLCTSIFGHNGPSANTLCHQCDECTTEMCIQSMVGCDQFLSQLYGGCMQETNLAGDITSTVGQFLFFGAMIFCFFCLNKGKRSVGEIGPEQQQMTNSRGVMRTENGTRLGTMNLAGSYWESNGDNNNATYQWTVDTQGWFTGQCNDADGINQVIGGKLNWPAGEQGGEIAWLETRDEVQTEFHGRIQESQMGGGEVTVEAQFLSNYGGTTRGNLRLTGRSIASGAFGGGGFFGN